MTNERGEYVHVSKAGYPFRAYNHRSYGRWLFKCGACLRQWSRGVSEVRTWSRVPVEECQCGTQVKAGF